jgi:sugar O-acyltransferase (sialic acid O-acetyltransferase NeuD family)
MTAPRPLVVLGTGGNCVDLLDIVADVNRTGRQPPFRCIGFLDDERSRQGTTVAGLPVLGPLSSAGDHGDALFVNGIGSPRTVRRKQAILAGTGLDDERFVTLVHPLAFVSPRAELGRGTVLFPHVAIHSGASVGRHVIVLSGAVVNHDAVVGDYTCVTSGVRISGGVRLGRSCYLGTNSALRELVSIGDGAVVGMGAVVTADVAADTVVAGNPARVLRTTAGDG